jgi:predicted HicB family RNase H-like nuclease
VLTTQKGDTSKKERTAIMGTPGSSAPKGTVGTNKLEYKGYIGVIEYDDDAGLFHGEVINLRDVITFQGDCVAELRQALRDSVEDYLEFCAERGEEPEKPFSGNFPLRINPELHRKIYIKARSEGVSLNRWISDTLEKQVT